jgi:PTS system nitrogen regulatory IIA component
MNFTKLAAGWSKPWRLLGARDSNTLAAMLESDDIFLDLSVAGKDQLFSEVGRHMEQKHALPRDWVAGSLARREKIGSTGLGEGVAIPHARVKDLARVQVAYMRLNPPIPFDAPDGKPVLDVLVLLVPKQANEQHLKLLAAATELLSAQRFRDYLHACANPLEVKQVFDAWA